MNMAKKMLGLLLAVVLTVSIFSFAEIPASADNSKTETITYINADELTAGDWWDDGGTVTLEQARNNAIVIQNVLDTVGKNGGGTVVLPEGTYCIAGDYHTYGQYCLYIRYDNLTLRGAGKNGDAHKTVLRANSHWNASLSVLEADRVYRNSGIRIVGATWNTNGVARKNVSLECFEIDGSRGYTGASDWGYDPNVNYGWDVNHKGITVSQDDVVHNASLKDINIHSFSGETLYVGGQSVGYLEVLNCKMWDTNASCFNLYGAWLNVQNTQFGDPDGSCRFWIEYSPRPTNITFDKSLVPSTYKYPVNTAYFANNKFYNSADNHGIALTQGNCGEYTTIFEKNYFSNPKGKLNFSIFQMAGAIYGPTYFRQNTFEDIVGPVLNFAFGGGGTIDENGEPNDWTKNKNIYLQDNVGINVGGDSIVDMSCNFNNTLRWQPIENMIISGNDFSSRVSHYCAVEVSEIADLKNVRIYNNIFRNCKGPREVAESKGDVPYFANNTYVNTQFEIQGINSANSQMQPFCEKLFVSAGEALTASIRTGRYADGQRVIVSGATTTAPITLAANSPELGYDLEESYELRAGLEYELVYDAENAVWRHPENAWVTPTLTPDPDATYWSLNAQLAEIGNGHSLPYYGEAAAGIYTGLWQTDRLNSVTREGDHLRAQSGFGGNKTEVHMELPETYTTGKLIMKFDMLVEGPNNDPAWEDMVFNWLECGFAYNGGFVSRAVVGAEGRRKLDWDGDLTGDSTHYNDQWYTYEITLDLDNHTRSMVVYDEEGTELNRNRDVKSIPEGTAVNQIQFTNSQSGNYTDAAYLLRNMIVAVGELPEEDAPLPPSEPVTSEPTTSEPTTSEPTTSEPTTSEPTTSEPTTSEPTTSEPTTSEPEIIYGDVNDDGKVTSLDVVRLKRYVASYSFETGTSSVTVSAGADATGDGNINTLDVVRLKRYLASYSFETGSSTVILGPNK